MTLPIRTAAVVALLVASAPAFAAKGHLGFGIEVSTSGLFSPTLTKVMVKRVVPGSAAALAGLQPGDAVLEVDGHPVPGAPAREMAARLDLQSGQHLRMKVRHLNAAVANLDMIATP